jgi:hypothetical protein
MVDLSSRAQRLVDEFEEGESVRHGLANVLMHLANVFDVYFRSLDECMRGVPLTTLDELASELTAPTLLDRALSGDRKAAQQFLRKLGMIDEHGQLTGPYSLETPHD